MNSRGFTLIELIITIALLSMLFSLIATNMVGLQSRQLESNYNNYKMELESAACLFMDSKEAGLNNVVAVNPDFSAYANKGSAQENKIECIRIEACYIKSKTLLDYGFLSKDLKNPETGTSVTEGEVIRIFYLNGEKTCTYYSD